MAEIIKYEKPETRFTERPVNYREDDGKGIVEGVAIVYGKEVVIGGWFREIVEPGACSLAIANSDVRCLFNHNSSQILARSNKGAGTLTLEESNEGVSFKYITPDRQHARDVYDAIKTGDVTGCSFSWDDEEAEWIHSVNKEELPLHRISKINNLLDVGPVTYPSYEMTSTSARAADHASIPDSTYSELEEIEIALALHRYGH